ncbi:hypothetical protein Esti_002856 [Eimeria stiedai]
MDWRSSTPRRATHAGSWYDSDKANLTEELHRCLQRASKTCHGTAKAIICPHAGLRFAGPTAAYAWKQGLRLLICSKRVFLLGPSHHKYFRGVALPPDGCPSYATPLGDLPLDNEILGSLRGTQAFSVLSPSEDEAEHSIELLLPFVRHVFSSADVKIVPLVVGDLKTDNAFLKYAELLLEYFMRDDVLFAFSSDFCHWGPRYSYYYLEEPLAGLPIHANIERMDRKAAGFITRHQGKEFSEYLERTGLSVCGRNPISIFLKLVDLAAAKGASNFKTELLAYSQSSHAATRSDSSVSYAALCTTRVQGLGLGV